LLLFLPLPVRVLDLVVFASLLFAVSVPSASGVVAVVVLTLLNNENDNSERMRSIIPAILGIADQEQSFLAVLSGSG